MIPQPHIYPIVNQSSLFSLVGDGGFFSHELHCFYVLPYIEGSGQWMYTTEPGIQNVLVRSLSKLVKSHVITKYKNSYKSDNIKMLLKINAQYM